MAIAATLEQYLADHHVDYEVIDHTPTMTASRSAQQSHVSGDCLAKAVVVKDEEGLMLAVVPASHHIKLGALSDLLDAIALESAAPEMSWQSDRARARRQFESDDDLGLATEIEYGWPDDAKTHR